MYIAALNIIGDTEGVELTCLVQPRTGCLHDYQMTPADRQRLQQTDVMLVSGAGAEAFLEPVLASLPTLPVVDASKGIALLPSGHHHEEHEHEEHEHEEACNEHIWAAPATYRQQVLNLAEGLAAADAAHAQVYRRNAAAYCAAIDTVQAKLTAAVAAGGYTKCLLFSESLAYLAQELELEVLGTLSIGEQATVSAAELAAAEQAIAGQKVLLLYDAQYDRLYTDLQRHAAEGRILSLDIAVQGEPKADAWLTAMEKNAALLGGGAA